MKKKNFAELIASIREGGEILRGKRKPSRSFKFNAPPVKSTRKRLKLSQSQFAHLLGISKATLQNWEQGRCEPDGPAKALLRVAAKRPDVVLEALKGKSA